MKRLTQKEINLGRKWCDEHLRNKEKVLAVWKHMGDNYCQECADKIKPESTNFSEADYQTWLKI